MFSIRVFPHFPEIALVVWDGSPLLGRLWLQTLFMEKLAFLFYCHFPQSFLFFAYVVCSNDFPFSFHCLHSCCMWLFFLHICFFYASRYTRHTSNIPTSTYIYIHKYNSLGINTIDKETREYKMLPHFYWYLTTIFSNKFSWIEIQVMGKGSFWSKNLHSFMEIFIWYLLCQATSHCSHSTP